MGKWTDGKRYAYLTLELNEDKLLELIGEDDVEIESAEGCIEVKLVLNGRTYYDSGCMYFSNGDPGDPPEYDEEFPMCEEDEKYLQKRIGNLLYTTLSIDDEVEYDEKE